MVRIPIFGYLYKRAAIMVDRNSSKSRFGVYNRAQRVIDKGYSICIFPEIEYTYESILLNPFKKGAFSLAIEFEIPIIPQVYYDCKRFFSWDIFKGRPGTLRIDQQNLIETKGLSLGKDMEVLKDKTFHLIYNELEREAEYMKDTNRKR